MSMKFMMTYYDSLPAIKLLSDSERGRLFLSLLEYGNRRNINGYQTPNSPGRESFLFEMLKAQMDRDEEKYQEMCQRNKQNRQKSGKNKEKEIDESSPADTSRDYKKEKEKEKNKDKKDEEEKDEDEEDNEYISPLSADADIPPARGNGQLQETAQQVAMLNFERFYSLYPKKKKRAKVLSWFLKHQPSCELVAKMLEAVNQQSLTLDWQKANGKYIPHPYSWLNAEAWENEIDQSEIADTSEKSASRLLAIELFERLRRQHYEKSAKNEKLIKSWAVVIDEHLSLERTKEREDRIFYAIKQATTVDYWKGRIVDAESLIKNINFIK